MKIILSSVLLIISISVQAQQENLKFNRVQDAFEVIKEAKGKNERYAEMLRYPGMSVGVYSLKKNDEDHQSPHTEDEVYYVLTGKAKIKIGTENFDVREGNVIFVEANKEHRFFDVTEDFSVLVFFAPEYGANKKK